MSKNAIIYQTLKDLNNDSYVELNGPFQDCDEDAWLGKGFYFWDADIEVAKRWGQVSVERWNNCSNFIICRSFYDCKGDNFFDLLADTEDKKEFWDTVSYLENKFRGKELFVWHVIKELKKDKEFCSKYKAVRAFPPHAMSVKDNRTIRFHRSNTRSYLEETFAVQLCVWDRTFLLGDFKIIYHSKNDIEEQDYYVC